jgi:hypothetical protein
MGKNPLVYMFEQELQEYISEKSREIGKELLENYKDLGFRIELKIYYRKLEERNGNGRNQREN